MRKLAGSCCFGLGVFFILSSGWTGGNLRADIRPDKIRTADAKKTQAYIRDGMIVGGDRAVNEVIVRDIRRAANPAGFERIVIDLEGNHDGEPVAIPRPPFFQVAVNADEKRIVVTIFGKPRLNFDARRVLAAFKRSPVVENVVFYPALEEGSWTFSLEMKAAYPVEVFELTKPVRIILDVKSRMPAAQPVSSHRRAKGKLRSKAAAQPAIELDSNAAAGDAAASGDDLSEELR